jgi:hypothetical protein
MEPSWLGWLLPCQANGVGIDGLNDEALIYNSRVTGSGKWAEALLGLCELAETNRATERDCSSGFRLNSEKC